MISEDKVSGLTQEHTRMVFDSKDISCTKKTPSTAS